MRFLDRPAGQGQDSGGDAVAVGAGVDDVDDLPFSVEGLVMWMVVGYVLVEGS